MRPMVASLFAVCLLLAATIVGCADQITAEEIVTRMQETVDSTDDAHAVVTANIDAQGIQISLTAEVWEKSPNLFRAQVLDASEPRFVGTLMVSDGDQAWHYEPDRNRVQVGARGEVEMPLPQEMLTSLQDEIQKVLDASDVVLVGEESVAGREAYKLTVEPLEDAQQELFPGNGIATLWVDKEQWIILKASYQASAFGAGDMEVKSFELNPGLEDELFHFEVPEGATVIDLEQQKPQPLTLDEAKAHAPFPLLVPGYVPEGATLIEILQVGDSFVLRYDHSTLVSFAVVQGPELAGPPPLGQSQATNVRGQNATVVTDSVGGNTFLYWTEDGVTVTVAGHISLEDALRVADSLE